MFEAYPVFRKCLLTLLIMAAWALLPWSATQAQDSGPIILNPVGQSSDEFGPAGFMEILVTGPAGTWVQPQINQSLDVGQWTNYGEPVMLGENPAVLVAPHLSDNIASFFRVIRIAPPAEIAVAEGKIGLVLNEPVSADFLLAQLGMHLNQDVFPRDDEGADRIVPEGKYSAANLHSLLRQLELPTWVPPSNREDDPKLEDPSIPSTIFQFGKPIVDPGDVGTGVIDDGWKGDGIEERPTDGPSVPETPHPEADRPFEPKLPDVPDGLLQEPDPKFREPGAHLRLRLLLDKKGGFELKLAKQDEGDGLLADFFPVPEPGSLIAVVRSPNWQGDQFGVYHIGVFSNPWAEHSYDPPYRGVHGQTETDLADLDFPVPLLDPEWGIEGLEVTLYRVHAPIDGEVLSPEVFHRNEKNFELLAGINMADILAALKESAAKPRLQAASRDPEMTVLHRSGSNASKYNLVIIGDGFDDSDADQQAFNDYVENTIINQWLTRDIHPEVLNAINIFRVNTFSNESGITRVNSNGTVTSSVDSALEYRYSGDWNRCWMEPGPNSGDLINAAINSVLNGADGIAIVLNTSNGGGCRRGSQLAVTLASSANTFAHEFGHLFGGLGDEYQCTQGSNGCGSYTGSEPGAVNLTTVTNRNNVKWKRWIPSWRPVPTAQANTASNSQDAGIFPGAVTSLTRYWNGIFRPSWRGRMNTDTSVVHNPIGYTRMRENAKPRQEADLRKNVVGDFDGDGRVDLVILDGRQISLYLARDRDVGPDDPVRGRAPRNVTGVLEPTWYHTDLLRNAARTRSWQFRPGDKFFAGDFDGDGLDDLYVVNLTNWAKPYMCMLRSFGDRFEPVRRYDQKLPGWDDMRANDEFYVLDFNGDGMDDLGVFNGQNWSMPYFIMLRSTGTSVVYTKRYDRYLPGWEMGKREKFHVGNFDGDAQNMEEVISLNTRDWNQVHLMVFSSSGTQLGLSDRHYGSIHHPFWTMRRNDTLYPLDFNGNGTTDIAIFNGKDWGPEYLALLSLDKGKLNGVRRYDDTVPGWDMQRRDQFWVGDINGDQNDDLVVYNKDNWSTQYLGILRSNGDNGLQGSWQDDWIGSWNLGSGDSFHVADFRGGAGWDDLFVFNRTWFGLLRSYRTYFVQETIYPNWIHNHRYHGLGWW